VLSSLTSPISVRASLRGTSSDQDNRVSHGTQLDLDVSFFCRLFYEHFAGDEKDVNKGFLMSCLLIIVCAWMYFRVCAR
jgi:hypothetical protein